MKKGTQKAILVFLGVIGTAIYLYLTYYSFRFSYQFHMTYDETAEDVADKIWPHLLSLAVWLLIALYFIFGVYPKLQEKVRKWIHFLFLAVCILGTTALAIWWVRLGDFAPYADQLTVYEAALGVPQGDYSYFHNGGYMGTVHYQMGMMLLFQFFMGIAKSGSYQVIQMANAFTIPFVVLFGYLFIHELLQDEKAELLYFVLMMGCMPIPLHSTFVYGESICMFAGCGLLWAALMLCRRRKWFYLIPMGLFSALGILAKGSNWILCIAIATLFLVLFAIQKEKLLLIAIPVIFLLPVILSAGITQHFRTLTGYPLDQGEPTSAVVAMGMQEGVWNAGWFNGYNFQLYGQNNFESKATDKAAKDYIHQRIQEFKANPDMARDFYHRKVLSQWNCPDYEVFVASREVKNDPTGLIEKIQKGNLHSGILAFLNGYQLILYLGMLFASLAAIFWIRQVENALPLLISIGAFLFSILWEAKTRYQIPMLPYMVITSTIGWYFLLRETSGRVFGKKY